MIESVQHGDGGAGGGRIRGGDRHRPAQVLAALRSLDPIGLGLDVAAGALRSTAVI
ncbi:hypothetical protein [Rhodococcus sp. USK13]|uniref:hypothetical protein n=1 Tax=Rhodococcus sp. USK13 TaxID=2806442 RepID=UPI001BCCC638|nr:hypothetical protein [Rhodococcus sp. USK13]